MVNHNIAILLVTYNSEKHIIRLIESLNNQSYKEFTLFVLDNNSSDSTISLLYSGRNAFEIVVIEEKVNYGYAKGNNILARKALKSNYEFLFIINADMQLNKDCLAELLRFMYKTPGADVVGPLLLFGLGKDKNKIQSYGRIVDFRKRKLKEVFYSDRTNINQLPESKQVNFINGGSIFIKASVFKKVGFFDERYFMYGEEFDLFYRIKKQGYKIFVTKKAMVYHYHNYSRSNIKSYIFEYYLVNRSKILYFKKYKLHQYLYIKLLNELMTVPLKMYFFIKMDSINLCRYYYLGYIHGLIGKKGDNLPKFG